MSPAERNTVLFGQISVADMLVDMEKKGVQSSSIILGGDNPVAACFFCRNLQKIKMIQAILEGEI